MSEAIAWNESTLISFSLNQYAFALDLSEIATSVNESIWRLEKN